MSDNGELAARLAALSDAELVALLRVTVAPRSGLWALRTALDELAAVDHTHDDPGVSSDTREAAGFGGGPAREASGQVGGMIPVPPVPGGSPVISDIPSTSGYSASGVPTFDSVRDKVEQRFGTAQGMGELDRQTPAGRSADEQFEARERAARERLDRIRQSLRDPSDPPAP